MQRVYNIFQGNSERMVIGCGTGEATRDADINSNDAFKVQAFFGE